MAHKAAGPKGFKESQELWFYFFGTLSAVPKAFEIEITPEYNVAAQIGDKLELTCSTIGCESPSFSWRSQLDKPRAFPSDPVIEISTPLNVGEKASITCMVPKVYPSERLKMQLEKDGSVLEMKEFYEEGITETTETKSLTLTFIPTFEDIGKAITCVAQLPIDEMEFEPKKRQTSQRLSVNFGPQNANITVSPSNTTMQGETLMLTCRTTSNPPARIVWGKELEDSSVQHIIDNDSLIIPHAQMSDSGLFICEAMNDATNKSERTTVVISVQRMRLITELSIQPSTTVQEGNNVTILCSVESNPAARIVLRRKSDSEDTVFYSEDGVVHISSVTFLNAGNYECEAENALGESKMASELSMGYGPRNMTVSVTPSTTVKEGGAVTMTCTSYGNPAPKISWTKYLISGESQFLSEDATLTINNVKAEDLGLYELLLGITIPVLCFQVAADYLDFLQHSRSGLFRECAKFREVKR
ncbi:Vascular cell adhesion protein 1 [Platysternon megacephalum]|uniref:Vascular cell adhesion protein 1 n=1 Tax=Platysternon megacephalum TaxID=55544 RepID=A0A4D9E6G8_9SAUR|nr:Vascular cell adhesion protein 1 [Platysternon megacephalum]